MGAVPFDTLKLARRLESAGFPPQQAGDTAEALAEAMSGAQLATSADIASVRTEVTTQGSELRTEIRTQGSQLRAEIAAQGSELRADIAAQGLELRAEIAALRSEFRAETAALRAELRAEIELLRRDLTIRLGSMIVVAVGILLAAIRYLPPPH
ncbi:MAG: coiled-coil domain-containing protein [Stellaceae bacterium]